LSERRREKRLRRKLRIKLGQDEVAQAGFTTNISEGGLSVRCQYLHEPGTHLRATLMLPSEEAVELELQVRWSRPLSKVHPWQPAAMMGLIMVKPPVRSYLDYLVAACRAPDAEFEPYHPAPPTAATPGAAAPAPSSSVGSPPVLSGAPPSQSQVLQRLGAGASLLLSSAGMRLAAGQAGRLETLVKGEDLAAPADVVPSSLSTTSAAALVERAAERAIAAQLPPGAVSMGVRIELSVSHQLPATVGTKLLTVATVVDVAPTGKTVTFEATITDGGRAIVTAKHVRAVVERRAGR
jgi:predicted thioesterase